jgi:hypothetical protein
MRKILLLTGLTGVLLLDGAPAAMAEEQDEDWRDQFEYDFQIEGLDKLMQGMDEFLRSIPRFEAPYIDENGDIVIRRAPPLEPEFNPFRRPTEPEFADI